MPMGLVLVYKVLLYACSIYIPPLWSFDDWVILLLGKKFFRQNASP